MVVARAVECIYASGSTSSLRTPHATVASPRSELGGERWRGSLVRPRAALCARRAVVSSRRGLHVRSIDASKSISTPRALVDRQASRGRRTRQCSARCAAQCAKGRSTWCWRCAVNHATKAITGSACMSPGRIQVPTEVPTLSRLHPVSLSPDHSKKPRNSVFLGRGGRIRTSDI